jgi:amidase
MPVAPPVAAALRDAAKRLEAAGWIVEEVPAPPLMESARLQAILWLGETRRGGTAAMEREADPDALQVFGYMERLCPPIDGNAVQDALQRRLGLLREWLAFLDKYPVLLLPVSGELPFKDHDDVVSFERFEQIMAAQLPQVGLPLLSLPGLTVSTGMVGTVPVGVQLIGSRYREDILLAAGAAIEAGGAPASPIDPR